MRSLNQPKLLFSAQSSVVSSIAISQSQFNISHLFAHSLFYLTLDRTLLGTATPGQSELRTNGNEGVLYISEISKAGASPSDGLMLYLWHSLSLCRDAVGVFYSLSQQGRFVFDFSNNANSSSIKL